MPGPSDAPTHEAYIEALDEPRRADIRPLHELICATVPQLEPTMEFGMKRYISLYVTATGADGRYLAEAYAENPPGTMR